MVENAYGTKKTDKDMKDIANTKRQKPAMLCGGGSMGKYAEGGSLKAVDTEANPGLAKLPTNIRNKMGYAKKGGKVC
jgi:hypothetical protein